MTRRNAESITVTCSFCDHQVAEGPSWSDEMIEHFRTDHPERYTEFALLAKIEHGITI
jgi:hypothetical protein